MNFATIFFTGLLTGGLTCLAVQGGLLATTISQRKGKNLSSAQMDGNDALTIFVFLLAKLVAYTILGFLLGWFGSVLELSLTVRVVMQFLVALFMIGTALNMLSAHPIFRYFVIQPPRFLTKMVRNQSKNSDLFAPILLGLFTVFIPCGTTQAMMALAIASGSPTLGALTMFIFILGTSPIFFLLGYFATRLGDAFKMQFNRIAATLIILLAFFNLDGALALTGSSWTVRNLSKNIYCSISFCVQAQEQVAGSAVTNTTITLNQSGYMPNRFSVNRGSHVTLNLINKNASGCIQAFTIPQLNIQKIVSVGKEEKLEFDAPGKPGEIAFMCSMGMYRGVMEVL